jgi:hypothetical protein
VGLGNLPFLLSGYTASAPVENDAFQVYNFVFHAGKLRGEVAELVLVLGFLRLQVGKVAV